MSDSVQPQRQQPTRLPIPEILQGRTLKWVAISSSNERKWKVKVKSLSRVWPSVTPLTAAYQAPPSMGFSRQEYWSGVPLPSVREKKKNVFNIGAKLQCINSTTSQYPELYITILDKNLSYLVYNSRGEKHLESAKLALRLLLLV